jgi:hypothetical protein
MNIPPVILLGMLAFGAGWGADAWLGRRGNEVTKKGTRIPAVARGGPAAVNTGATAGASSASAPATPGSLTNSSSAKTLADFRQLIKGVPYSTGRARAGAAIERLTAEELAALAGELLAASPGDRSKLEFPSQITNPLLRRWFALAPMEALRFYREAGQRMEHGPEVSGAYFTALQAAFRAHPEEVWDIAVKTREGFDGPNKACLSALEDMPPGDAMKLMVSLGQRSDVRQEYPEYAGDLPARWIASDPQEAMNWALALPANSARSSLVERLWREWIAQDSTAAMAWYEAAPPGVLPAGKLRRHLREVIFFHKLDQ